MFTGIITGLGTVLLIERKERAAKIQIRTQLDGEPLTIGESVAVNGTCLTVTRFTPDSFTAEISLETLSRTTLRHLQTGDAVNLERALRLSDRLGGHLVTGHVDGVGAVSRITPEGEGVRAFVEAPGSICRRLVFKGSVTLDGISLTVASCNPSGFSVALIPHTLQATTARTWRPGSRINVEVDLIGRYVEQLMQPVQDPPFRDQEGA